MLQDRSLVKIADNSGGQIGRVFKILGGSKKRYAEIGDEVVLSIQTAQPRKAVKKKDVHRAVVVHRSVHAGLPVTPHHARGALCRWQRFGPAGPDPGRHSLAAAGAAHRR